MNLQLQAILDETLARAYPAGGPGAAVIAVRNGETIFRKGFGLANLELGVPIEPEMVFRIGSVTKQFTAVSVLMLMEQGKLALDDPLTRFLPDYPMQPHTITVEHLLTHTSGIQSYTSMPAWPPLWRKDFTLKELIDFFKDQPMQFAPGTRWSYNNSAYCLLGAVIEQAGGQTYEAFLRERIFEPLGMRQTCYDHTDAIIPRRAPGYTKSPNGFINAPYLSMTQPHAAGALASTVDDLAKWDAALYDGTLLRPETLARAFTPFRLNDGTSTSYGYGWSISQYDGLATIEHGGGINGFTCHALRIPSERVFVAVLTNCDSHTIDPEFAAVQVAGHVLGRPWHEPRPIALGAEVLQALAGVYRMEDGGDEITVKVEDAGLCAQLGPMHWTLLPTSPSEFVVRERPLLRLFFAPGELKLAGRSGMGNVAKKTEQPLPA
jgi:D-alanyl-D-alanine carboxypeptidase